MFKNHIINSEGKMLLQTTISSSPPLKHHHQLSLSNSHSLLPFGHVNFIRRQCSLQAVSQRYVSSGLIACRAHALNISRLPNLKIHQMELATGLCNSTGPEDLKRLIVWASALSFGQISWLLSVQVAYAAESIKTDAVYEIGELFELGIQLSYLLLLLALLGVGTFFVIRQVLVRRELDLSAKELQEQVRSGDATATELFELGAVMLRRKFYPAAIKYLLEAIEKWDGDDQDLAQVHNALGVTYVRDGKLDKGIAQFKAAVKLQPGYVTAWNNLGDAHEKNKDLQSALKAFEEALLFDPNNKVARPRRDVLKDRVNVYKGVPVKSKDR